jgi:hypothetical protein
MWTHYYQRELKHNTNAYPFVISLPRLSPHLEIFAAPFPSSPLNLIFYFPLNLSLLLTTGSGGGAGARGPRRRSHGRVRDHPPTRSRASTGRGGACGRPPSGGSAGAARGENRAGGGLCRAASPRRGRVGTMRGSAEPRRSGGRQRPSWRWCASKPCLSPFF